MSSAAVQEDWKKRWEQQETPGWQRSQVDVHLQEHVKELTQGEPNASILVTWCGKSLDVPWLCSQGYNVVGVELSEIAVRKMFEENSIPHSVAKEGGLTSYQAKDRKLKVFSGDYYKLTPGVAGMFEAVWDNNAFGAAEIADRQKYIAILLSMLKPNGRILLGSWEYGAVVRNSAPFSLSRELVKELFQDKLIVQFLGKCELFSEYFKAKFQADWAYQNIHLLSCKSV